MGLLKKAGGFISTGGLGMNLSGHKSGNLLGGALTGFIPGASDSIFGGPFGANPFDPLDISGNTARQFQATQAEADRKWQEYMSNTAHQREMADLKAAGLNPVLTASGGNGAPVTGGAMAGNATGNPEALSSILNVLVGLKNAKSNAKMAQTTEKDIESQITQRSAHTANETAETVARIENIKQDIINKQLEAEAQKLANADNLRYGTTKETPQAERMARHYTKNVISTPILIKDRIKGNIKHNKIVKETRKKLKAIDYSKLNENQKAHYRKLWIEYMRNKGA